MKSALICTTAVICLVPLLAGCASSDERRMNDEVRRLAASRLSAVRAATAAEPEASGEAARGLPRLDESATLADCLAYAALNNPGLESAFNQWQAALARVPQARSLPDPRLTYRYFIREVETRVGPQRESFELSQTLPWFGKLDLQGSMAMQEARAAQQRFEAAKLRLFYLVREPWYEYYYWSRAVEITRSNRDLLRNMELVARTRYKVAAAQSSDVIRAQVELGKIEDRLSTLVDLREPIVARLNAALGRPPGASLSVPQAIADESPAVTAEQILAWLGESNPELKAMDFEAARQEDAVALARKNYYPDLTLGTSVIDTREARMAGTPDSGKDPVIVMLSVNLPIWFDKLDAGVREARSRHMAALKARQNRYNQLAAEARMVLYELRDARRKIDLYRDTLIPKGRQALQSTDEAYRSGSASFNGLLDAQRTLLEFDLSYERALATQAQRLAELEMLLGRDLPRGSPGQGGATPAASPSDAEPAEPAAVEPAEMSPAGSAATGKDESGGTMP